MPTRFSERYLHSAIEQTGEQWLVLGPFFHLQSFTILCQTASVVRCIVLSCSKILSIYHECSDPVHLRLHGFCYFLPLSILTQTNDVQDTFLTHNITSYPSIYPASIEIILLFLPSLVYQFFFPFPSFIPGEPWWCLIKDFETMSIRKSIASLKRLGKLVR